VLLGSGLVENLDEESPGRTKVKSPSAVKFMEGLGLNSPSLQSPVDFVHLLSGVLPEADMEGPGVFNLGGLLEVVQAQDEPRLVAHHDEGIIFPTHDAAEAEVGLEKIARLLHIGDGEIEMVQSHIILLQFLNVASRKARSKAIAPTVGRW
jgi:hypothetical protein